MAPILASPSGVTPQKLGHPDLIQLLHRLKDLELVESEESLKLLTALLEPYKEQWPFEDTVRLFCFMHNVVFKY